MPKPYPVKPDRDFLHRVLAEGGEDLKKCFQCATCSVVCELSDGKSPFPRKGGTRTIFKLVGTNRLCTNSENFCIWIPDTERRWPEVRDQSVRWAGADKAGPGSSQFAVADQQALAAHLHAGYLLIGLDRFPARPRY